MQNPHRRGAGRRNAASLVAFGVGNPGGKKMSTRRRRRRSGARDRFGRFLKSRAHNPRRRRRVARRRHSYRSNPRRRSYARRRFTFRRRNPAAGSLIPSTSTVGTIAAIAIGAIVVRAITPRITSLIPVPQLQVGWGAVVSTGIVGMAASWAVSKFLNKSWGRAVMAGTVAVVAVEASDLVIPALPAPSAGEYGSVGAYIGATPLGAGPGGEESVGFYSGPGY